MPPALEATRTAPRRTLHRSDLEQRSRSRVGLQALGGTLLLLVFRKFGGSGYFEAVLRPESLAKHPNLPMSKKELNEYLKELDERAAKKAGN